MNSISTHPQLLIIPSTFPYLTEYKVVFEKKEGSLQMQKMRKSATGYFEMLYLAVQEDPKQHFEDLKKFQQEHSHVPEIASLLIYAYLRLKKKKQAELLTELTWKQHPDHLVARINYADQLIRLGKKERVEEIFKGCFDLNLLYPEKKSFHFSEFRGFMTVMGFYHLTMKQREKAEECYELAFQVDPLHPSVASLEKALSKSLPRFIKICRLFSKT